MEEELIINTNKNNNMVFLANSRNPLCRIPTFSQESNKTSEQHEMTVQVGSVVATEEAAVQRDCGIRERLTRHREEVAGRVLIPEKWGKEEFLGEWMDYSSFDTILAPTGIASAREALVAEGRRRDRAIASGREASARQGCSQRLRIESRC